MMIQATNSIASGSPPDQSPSDITAPFQPAAAQSGPAIDSAASAQLSKNQLADALQKVGIKAEIDFSKQGYTIVKYIDPESNQVMLQIPNETVIALVANLSQVFEKTDPAAAGAMIDRRA